MTKQDPKSGADFTLRDTDEPSPDRGSLPRIDFSTFVLSLGTSGMVHLGMLPQAAGAEQGEPDLALAQQTIDTLEMLVEKTRGNLDEEESKLVQSILYELRMGFVRAKD